MGFSHKQRKWRDRIRQEYTDETGKADYAAPEFEAWLIARGILSPGTV